MKVYKVIGLMSGTSLDGLDIAYCHISKTLNQWKYSIEHTKSIPYDDDLREKLKNAIFLSADALLNFNNWYGAWLGEQVQLFVKKHGVQVDFVSSHGHTTHHQPQHGLTYQIGSGQHLSNASGLKVVCDFRTNDVALGGQGAPLVPIGDRLFFGAYDFCLNLGGISNVSFEKGTDRIAYDIGLANMVLNHITQKIGISYDDGGKMAKKGSINEPMLQQLNALAYYTLPYPKSTGYEWFTKKVVPILEQTDDRTENLLHTSVHHICQQLAIQLKQHADTTEKTIFVTGGGAMNHFLIDTLRRKLGGDFKIVVPSRTLIEYKEALVFALMGVLRVVCETNVLCSVTGAKSDSSSGVLFLPQ